MSKERPTVTSVVTPTGPVSRERLSEGRRNQSPHGIVSEKAIVCPDGDIVTTLVTYHYPDLGYRYFCKRCKRMVGKRHDKSAGRQAAIALFKHCQEMAVESKRKWRESGQYDDELLAFLEDVVDTTLLFRPPDPVREAAESEERKEERRWFSAEVGHFLYKEKLPPGHLTPREIMIKFKVGPFADGKGADEAKPSSVTSSSKDQA